VTLSVKGKRHGTHRLPMAAWAGGLAAAALLVIFAVGPWKMQRTDMKLPGDYYIHMTENYSLGLVEEILAVSGLQVTDMDRALEQEIFLTGNPDYADPFEEAFQPDLYESMDETTMRMFEKLIEDITPAGVERG